MFKRVLQTALTPTINMLNVAGLISIPGMMTGQILAGGDAVVAAKYQARAALIFSFMLDCVFAPPPLHLPFWV